MVFATAGAATEVFTSTTGEPVCAGSLFLPLQLANRVTNKHIDHAVNNVFFFIHDSFFLT
jgi:hypothetical protein